MGNFYAIKDTTLTALGDAIRIHKPTRIETVNTGEAITVKNSKNIMMNIWTSSYFDTIGIDGASSVRLQIATNHPDGTMFYIYRGKYTKDEIANIEPYLTFDARIGRLLQNAMAGTEYEYFDIPDTDYLSLYMVGSTGSTSYSWYASLTGYDENGETIMKYEDVEVVNTMTPLQMADTISEFNIPNIEPIELTGDISYCGSGALGNEYIKLFAHTITTKDITTMSYSFNKTTLEEIPLVINCKINNATSATAMFQDAKNLKILPKINNLDMKEGSYFFNSCFSLREVPDDFCDNWTWASMDGTTSAYSGSRGNSFQNCYSLRKFPMSFLAHANPVANSSQSIYNYLFSYCMSLDEVVNLTLPHTATYTSNIFNKTLAYTARLKRFTFETDNGVPYVKPWKNQTIVLSEYCGYVSNSSYYIDMITKYNSGITAGKKVIDNATYQALKNDPDWWSADVNYSRYNHDSAVETINSLPDCSATGTNTIKFKGASGALTDGGAINTLTEEEIAVATAKGWTVSFT